MQRIGFFERICVDKAAAFFCCLFLALWWSGCGLAKVDEKWKLPFNPSGSDTPGEAGKYGAGRAFWWAQPRPDEFCGIEVLYPRDQNGQLAKNAKPFSILLQISRTPLWLISHLVSRGYLLVRNIESKEVNSLTTNLSNSKECSIHDALNALYRESARSNSPLVGSISDQSEISLLVIEGVLSPRTWTEWAGSTKIRGLLLLEGLPEASSQKPVGSSQQIEINKDHPKAILSLLATAKRTGVDDSKHTHPLSLFSNSNVDLFLGNVEQMYPSEWFDEFRASQKHIDITAEPPAFGIKTASVRKSALRVIDVWLSAHLRKDQNALNQLNNSTFDGIRRGK